MTINEQQILYLFIYVISFMGIFTYKMLNIQSCTFFSDFTTFYLKQQQQKTFFAVIHIKSNHYLTQTLFFQWGK